MGEKGEGFTGTIIKDIWTKTGEWKWGREVGRGGMVRRGGEEAENYLNNNNKKEKEYEMTKGEKNDFEKEGGGQNNKSRE